jgi:transposase-like protein
MVQAARRVVAKDPNEKLAHRRMTVLELAERLGNVTEACRRGGIDRTSFYDWKRRFQLEGLDGLKDLPPIAKSHPMTTPPEVVARIEALALEHPAYGCNRIEALLALEGRRVSAITVQKILNDKTWAAGTSAGWPWSGRMPTTRLS